MWKENPIFESLLGLGPSGRYLCKGGFPLFGEFHAWVSCILLGLRPLSDAQREELVVAREEARRAKDHRLSVRIRAILLATDGKHTRWQIAEICEVGLTTVFLWQRIYGEDGLGGLKGRYKPRSCALGDEELEQFKLALDGGPEAAGFDTGIWTAALAATLIKQLFGVEYTVSGVTKVLRRLRYSVQVPKVQLARASEEAQRVWKEETFPAIVKRAEEVDGTLFFTTNAASSSQERRPARGRGWVRERS